MKFEYVPVVATLLIAALVPALFLGVSALFGAKRMVWPSFFA